MSQRAGRGNRSERQGAVAVSIILPFYNESATIESCVAEIREAMKSHEDYELVIVNDGSTDVDAELLKRLADRVVHHGENCG